MRGLLVFAIAGFALAGSASAQTGSEGRYCLSSFGTGSSVNCSFDTLEQCLQSKTSNGDTCESNPRYVPRRERH